MLIFPLTGKFYTADTFIFMEEIPKHISATPNICIKHLNQILYMNCKIILGTKGQIVFFACLLFLGLLGLS